MISLSVRIKILLIQFFFQVQCNFAEMHDQFPVIQLDQNGGLLNAPGTAMEVS